ncbi:DUF3016 domain-containing protein [Noviherbaspirillum aerium]|uniref:DUF3016 domain-containing protein n=1 Tax=Noviherbaspirillum aerium TaxID=2588497 RepID=UPI001CEF99AC|nr:DUF3016 domain-containing protein [Noviherbaspirillum aerium]
MLALTAAMLLSGLNAVAGETKVGFIQPENFTDARLNRQAPGADAIVLATLERHLQQLGSRCLHQGHSLEIRIHDIDLAGQVEWWQGPSRQNRTMREITWPRIMLTYVLQRDGHAAAETQEDIRDIEYLLRSHHLRGESTPLPYERAMLTRWFEQRFCGK